MWQKNTNKRKKCQTEQKSLFPLFFVVKTLYHKEKLMVKSIYQDFNTILLNLYIQL